MAEGRTDKSIKNSTTALLAQGASVILSFVVRTIFVKVLGNSYLGINGLFTNVLSLLSFAELGFGTAIIYAMYTPIAENDEKKISAYMNFYAKAYRAIGLFILIAGIILIPFLDFFIGDTSQIPDGLPPIEFIYLLYLVNSASSYFFNYKRSIVTASQNGYLDSLNQLQFTALRNILQIVVLFVFKSFVGYLIVQIVCTLLGNIMISIKADKLFPFLKRNKKEQLDQTSVRAIVKNVAAMACHKLGSVIVSGTDNILITKFVGLVVTGQYSNYTLLTSTIRTVYLQILSPITASVGNLIATENSEKSYNFFKRIFFMNSYIGVFCTVCLASLANPFIKLFWAESDTFSIPLVLLIMIVFYINCIRKTAEIYIDTIGLFWQIKWKSIIEGIINLVCSIVLAWPLKMGITGVVLGTFISNVTTNLWWEPYVVYKYYFKKPLKLYFADFTKYTFALGISLLCVFAIELPMDYNILTFLIKCCVSVAVPNLVMVLFFFRTDEFSYFISLLKAKLLKRH